MASQQRPQADLPDYILQIDLMNIKDPRISRTLSLPADSTFHTLHCAIQVSFDWRNCHLHNFEIYAATPEANGRRPHGILDRRPRILLKLDPHPEQDQSLFGPRPESSKTWKLSDVFENARLKNKAIEYYYDFGDHWMHSITLIGRALRKTNKIVCLSGEGRGPAEDCGGASGWQQLKDIYKYHPLGESDCEDENAHEKMGWYEDECLNGCKWGLERWSWNRDEVNAEFEKSDGLMALIARG